MIIFLPAAMASARKTAAASMCSSPDGGISAASSLDSSRGSEQAARGVQARQHGVHAALAQHLGVAERIGAGGDAGHGCNLASDGLIQNFFSERVLAVASARCVPLLHSQCQALDPAGLQRLQQRREPVAFQRVHALQPVGPVAGQRRFGQRVQYQQAAPRRGGHHCGGIAVRLAAAAACP